METLVIVGAIRMVIFPPLSFFGLPVTSMADNYVYGINEHCWTTIAELGLPSISSAQQCHSVPLSVMVTCTYN